MDKDGTSHSAATLRIEAVFHCDIVIYDDTSHLNPFHLSHFLSHFKVHNVTGIILNHHEDPSTLICFLDSLQDLVRCWRSKDCSANSGRKHALPNKARVGRLMTTATARNQANLACLLALTGNDIEALHPINQIAVNIGQALQHLVHNRCWIIDNFLHRCPPFLSVSLQRAIHPKKKALSF